MTDGAAPSRLPIEPSAALGVRPLASPGLFLTGTGTGVGKTVAACLIADQWRRRSTGRSRVGVFKPIATGCQPSRGGLRADDAERLAHAADFDPEIGPLGVVCPVRYRSAVAPAVAAATDGPPMDWGLIDRSVARLGERCDRVVVEGVGGLMTPIEDRAGRVVTVLDLARAIGVPVVVVCQAGLGTLSDTALTCHAVRQAGLPLAGLIVNGYDPESPDESMRTNRPWLERQNRTGVLATLPGRATLVGVEPLIARDAFDAGVIPESLRAAIDRTDFASLVRPGRTV